MNTGTFRHIYKVFISLTKLPVLTLGHEYDGAWSGMSNPSNSCNTDKRGFRSYVPTGDRLAVLVRGKRGSIVTLRSVPPVALGRLGGSCLR